VKKRGSPKWRCAMSARRLLPTASEVNFRSEFGVTLSLPSVVGHAGVLEVMQPELSSQERSAPN
jgi:malate/lactate dehydrogenase